MKSESGTTGPIWIFGRWTGRGGGGSRLGDRRRRRGSRLCGPGPPVSIPNSSDMASDPSGVQGNRKSDRTRQAILDAARVAFARKGFSGVTIRDITDLAGAARANFYYYFHDKTELFIELGTATYRESVEVVEAFGDLGDPPSPRR